MSHDLQLLIGTAALVLAISFGCSHCEKTRAEVQLIEAQTKQIDPSKK